MDAVVVDTDVVSYLHKKDSRGRLFRPHLIGRIWIISFISLAELERWALSRNWGLNARASLERHLQKFDIPYADRHLCRLWAEVTDRARRNGKPIDLADGWIAATSIALGVPLLTHNPKDYAGVGGLIIHSE